MRLFFLFLIFLIPPVLVWAGWVSLPLEQVRWGTASLGEDFPAGSTTAEVIFSQLSTEDGVTSGARHSVVLEVTAPETTHYKGEVVYLEFTRRNHCGLTLETFQYGGSYISRSLEMRGRFIGCLEGMLITRGEPGYLLMALLLGRAERAYEMKQLFRAAGVSHLLALSGLHRGIVAALFLFILKPIIPRRYLGHVLILILIGYSWIIGTNHSFLRALIMFTLVTGGLSMGIRPDMRKILPAAAIIQILLWPECIHTWSFLLSYGAMGGIIYLAGPWIFLLKRHLPPILASLLGVSLAAQAAVIPLILPGFGDFQCAGLVTGILLTPIITLYIWGGIVLIVLWSLFPVLNYTGESILELLFAIIRGVLRASSRIPMMVWERGGGRLLFILAISAIVVTGISVFFKDGKIVRSDIETKLRLPLGDKSPTGNDGAGSEKTMGTKFSYKQRSPGEDCGTPGN